MQLPGKIVEVPTKVQLLVLPTWYGLTALSKERGGEARISARQSQAMHAPPREQFACLECRLGSAEQHGW